jgi:hypothetical protein
MYMYTKTCRLCLCNEKFQMPIFGEVAQEMQICLKIRTCLPVQVGNRIKYELMLYMHNYVTLIMYAF